MKASIIALGWMLAFATSAGSQQDVLVAGPSGFYTFQDSINLSPNGYVNFPVTPLIAPMAFASLPSCVSATSGSLGVVTDSNTITWGANIANGGGNLVLAFCDGSHWTVAAK